MIKLRLKTVYKPVVQIMSFRLSSCTDNNHRQNSSDLPFSVPMPLTNRFQHRTDRKKLSHVRRRRNIQLDGTYLITINVGNSRTMMTVPPFCAFRKSLLYISLYIYTVYTIFYRNRDYFVNSNYLSAGME